MTLKTQDFKRHFNTCLPEWKLLSLYIFHRILFLLLIVSSLSCNLIAVPIVFSRSVNIAYRSTQNEALNHWIKNKHNKFFMLERNSVNAHSNTLRSSHYKSDGLAKSPRVLPSSWILNECNLYCKIVKYCFLSEVCMIKTVPHSTVSPQMWCINGIKGWFTRTQICWQDFVK